MKYIYDVSDMSFDGYISPKNLEDPDSFDEKTEVIKLFYYMVNEAKHLRIGEPFLIRDLFKGYIWNRLSQAQKAELGRLVSDYICAYTEHGVEEYFLSYVGKTKQGQMILKLVGWDEGIERVPRKGPKTNAPKLSDFHGDKEAFEKAFAMYVAEKRNNSKKLHKSFY